VYSALPILYILQESTQVLGVIDHPDSGWAPALPNAALRYFFEYTLFIASILNSGKNFVSLPDPGTNAGA
jgi:hypothetical protein